MKFIKKLFGLFVFLILLLCAGVTVCAFNPALTENLANLVEKLDLGNNGSHMEIAAAGDVLLLDDPGTLTDSVQLSVTDDIGELLRTRTNGQLPKVETYVAPGEEDVTAPAGLGDKQGYEPVSDVVREIGEEAANALERDLDTGNVGADYDFDAIYYPYYQMLNDTEKELYRQIYANAWDLTTSFVPVTRVDVDQVKRAFEAVYNDHPELFWLETGYSCQYLGNGKCVEISLKYNRTVNDLENARGAFGQAAENILTGASELGSDYEKEKYVHDALLETAEYDAAATMSQSAYSALVNHRSVCAGYARAYQYLLQRLGIPCYYCTGYSGGDHAWNIVQLSDGYYNVDVTWDDTKPATYDYFNRTDQDYATTHMRKNLSVYLPACLGTAYRNLEKGTPQSIGTEEPDENEENAEATGTDQDGVEEEPEELEVILNEHPRKPLTLDLKPATNTSTLTPVEGTASANEETTFGIEDYYADCLAQMVAAGTGQKTFVNVIPKALWDAVERSYSDGSYKTGYVNAALEKLGVNHFAIQLQVQRVGDGYYRLYHNIATW